MKVNMFNWFKSSPNVNGLIRRKITAITSHQSEEHLASGKMGASSEEDVYVG